MTRKLYDHGTMGDEWIIAEIHKANPKAAPQLVDRDAPIWLDAKPEDFETPQGRAVEEFEYHKGMAEYILEDFWTMLLIVGVTGLAFAAATWLAVLLGGA